MTHEELIAEAREAAFDARMDGSSRGTSLDELADALEQADATIEAVKLARGGHPACQKNPADNSLGCGWKAAVLDIDVALATGETK